MDNLRYFIDKYLYMSNLQHTLILISFAKSLSGKNC